MASVGLGEFILAGNLVIPKDGETNGRRWLSIVSWMSNGHLKETRIVSDG